MAQFSVYLIVNLITMKGYVGFTGTEVSRRFGKHKSDAKKGSRWILHASMRKHGFENFGVTVLATVCDRAEAVALEKSFIAEYSTRPPHGYNLTDGGDGARGYKHTQEFKQALSLRLKGRKRPAVEVEAMRQRALGKIPSDAARKRMSESQTGKRHPAATIEKMRQSALNRWAKNPFVMTPEWLERLRTYARTNVRTPEHNAAISRSLKGKKRSPETIEKYRLAAQRRERVKREAKQAMVSLPNGDTLTA